MNAPTRIEQPLEDLENAPLEQIQEMSDRLKAMLDARMKRKRKEALEQIQALVEEHELAFDDVVSAIRTKAKRGKAPPLYRNPENPRQTWSGKGEAPDWFRDHPNPKSLRIPGS